MAEAAQRDEAGSRRGFRDRSEERAYRALLLARGRRVVERGGRAPGRAPTGGGRSEAVMKVLSWGKSRRSVVGMVAYVARDRAEDRRAGREQPVLRDESGAVVAPAEARRRLERGGEWGLLDDADNLSPAARRAGAAVRRHMPEQERLQRRQAAHVMFSIGVAGAGDAERLEAAVAETVAEAFGEAGHPALWCLHRDHGNRLHAHVVVGARSRVTGRGLRLGRRELMLLRALFAERAQAVGLAVHATQRMDRPEVRDAVLAGRERLRAGWRAAPGRGALPRRPGHLEARAPEWSAGWGAWARARRPDRARPPLPAVGVPPPAPGEDATGRRERVGALFGLLFEDAGQARRAFDSLRAELQEREGSEDLAHWWLVHHPEAFGRPRRRLGGRQAQRRLRRLLQGVRPEPAAPPSLDRVSARRLLEQAERRRVEAERRRDAAVMARDLSRLAEGLRSLPDADGLLEGVLAEARRAETVAVPPRRPIEREAEAGRRPGDTGHGL